MRPADRFYINNTTLVNDLKSRRRKIKSGEPQKINVADTKKNAIYTYYVISGGENDEELLTPMDYLVLDTVYSMYKANRGSRLSFSIRALFDAMSGSRGRNLSGERQKMLHDTLMKLNRLKITVLFTEERLRRAAARDDAGLMPEKIEDERLLAITEETSVGTSDIPRTVYHLHGKPPLYKYADINRQVMDMPYSMFACNTVKTEKGSDTRITNTMLLVNYWLKHALGYRRYILRKVRKRLPVTEIYYCYTEGKLPCLMDWLGESDDPRFWRTSQGIHKLRSVHQVVCAQLEPLVGKSGGILSWETIIRNERTGSTVPEGVRITF